MSKERARRRASREAERAAAEAVRLRRERRRQRRAALLRRLKRRPRRLAWGFGRRSVGQRSLIVGVGVALLLAVFYFAESWGTRLGLGLLVLLGLPVLATVSFDRKGMRL
jgi:Flp pilus assembly protein TadB